MRALLPVLALTLALATLTGCGDDTNTPATSSTNNATSSTNSGTTASTTGFWAECDPTAPACDEGFECTAVPPEDPLSTSDVQHRCTLGCHGDMPQPTPDSVDDALCAPHGGVCTRWELSCVPEDFWVASYQRECQTDADCDSGSAQVCRPTTDSPDSDFRLCAWPLCEEDSECPGFDVGSGYCLRDTVCVLWL